MREPKSHGDPSSSFRQNPCSSEGCWRSEYETPAQTGRLRTVLRQVSWLAGRCLRPSSRNPQAPVTSHGRRLAAHSCGGSAGLAPASLLAPDVDHRGDRGTICCSFVA
ncbi:hypothetical protein BV133_2622 [Blastochloris viridis]|uniref:Uncharacterized protein n=1 Tax=Blastochloris viridis TaxID=1079 RepID=A0A182D464_BLAVI|nr:hypothetical protein BV133_2622 [Blastochloris viridis]